MTSLTTEIIASAGLALNIVIAIVGLTWGLGKIRLTVRDEIDVHRDHIQADIENINREFGETIAALRQKVNDVQLEAAQQYVRRDGFWKAHDELKESLAALRMEWRADFLRLEAKIKVGG